MSNLRKTLVELFETQLQEGRKDDVVEASRTSMTLYPVHGTVCGNINIYPSNCPFYNQSKEAQEYIRKHTGDIYDEEGPDMISCVRQNEDMADICSQFVSFDADSNRIFCSASREGDQAEEDIETERLNREEYPEEYADENDKNNTTSA